MAFAAEKRLAWQNNSTVEMPGKAVRWEKLKYHGLDGGQKVRGAYICVPVSTLAGFFEAQCVYSENRLSACLLLKDGRTLQFARGSIGCVIDRELTAMYCEALKRENELYISPEWFCRYVFNLHVSACDDVIYITDHFNELSVNMADLIRDILNGTPVPDNYYDMLPEGGEEN